MSQKSSNSGQSRNRNFATVVYPESAPSNWLDILSESKIPVFVSPCHDKDINPTGEPKKPHYHVMVMYSGVKTDAQARDFFATIGGVGCEVVKDIRAYARYLIHADNPEKAQYSIDDVKAFGGAEYRKVIGSASDKLKAIREMIAWIEENDCTCFADLFTFASINRDDWFDVLCNSGAYVVKEFIKSRTWKLHHQEEK